MSSPNTNYGIRDIDVAADKYTGIVNVRIPIYSLETNQMQIPIILSYNASGIRADDITSLVGLGWNLHASGKITRSVRGKHDNLDNKEWVGHNINMVDGMFPIWYQEHFDTQPDQFYFEIPNSSGSFVMDSLGNGSLVPYQNMRIEYKNQVFRIYDKQGTCYVFSSSDVTNESYPQNPPETIPSYVSPWYLDKIVYLNGDKVEFYYERDSQGAHTIHYQYLQECYAIYNNQTKQYEPPLKAGKFYDLTHGTVVSNPHYLSKIAYKDQHIEFVYERESSDIPYGKKLTDIIVNHVRDSQMTKIRHFRFSYGHFSNNRLKLTGLKEMESPESERLICNFEYFEDVAPPARNSDGIDHWGYFRANIPHSGSTQTFPAIKVFAI